MLNKQQKDRRAMQNIPPDTDLTAQIWAPHVASYPASGAPPLLLGMHRVDTESQPNGGRGTPDDLAQTNARPPVNECWRVTKLQLTIERELSSRGVTAAMQQAIAIKRLFRDLRECQREPLRTVAGHFPFDNNALEWHCNIRGLPGTDYASTTLHLVMEFPISYPVQVSTVCLSLQRGCASDCVCR